MEPELRHEEQETGKAFDGLTGLEMGEDDRMTKPPATEKLPAGRQWEGR